MVIFACFAYMDTVCFRSGGWRRCKMLLQHGPVRGHRLYVSVGTQRGLLQRAACAATHSSCQTWLFASFGWNVSIQIMHILSSRSSQKQLMCLVEVHLTFIASRYRFLSKTCKHVIFLFEITDVTMTNMNRLDKSNNCVLLESIFVKL